MKTYLRLYDSSTKCYVARQQCMVNQFLHFRGNIVDSDVWFNNTKGMEL